MTRKKQSNKNYSTCDTCGGKYYWHWREAFDKFGFNDGDGQVETETVADALRDAGYTVEAMQWGLHNTIITSIEKDGMDYMPDDTSYYNVGYNDPKKYLPQKIIRLLNKRFPS